MRNALFEGVCTALVTPFSGGKVHRERLEQLLRRQMEADIPAMVLCGTTGEAPTLSDREKISIFRTGVRVCKGKSLIIAGTGSNDTAHALQLSREAQEAGVDALLVVSPYYNKATPEGLTEHYRAIAEGVSLPVILYNVPSRTGVDIPISVYRELSRIPNIAGVKEASASISKIARIRAACPDTFAVWSGNDDQAVPVMALGGKGVISVASNVVPMHMKKMTDAALKGDYKRASILQRKLLELMDALFLEVNPIPVKAAMSMIGLDCGGCRLPLTGAGIPCRDALKKALDRLLESAEEKPVSL